MFFWNYSRDSPRRVRKNPHQDGPCRLRVTYTSQRGQVTGNRCEFRTYIVKGQKQSLLDHSILPHFDLRRDEIVRSARPAVRRQFDNLAKKHHQERCRHSALWTCTKPEACPVPHCATNAFSDTTAQRAFHDTSAKSTTHQLHWSKPRCPMAKSTNARQTCMRIAGALQGIHAACAACAVWKGWLSSTLLEDWIKSFPQPKVRAKSLPSGPGCMHTVCLQAC